MASLSDKERLQTSGLGSLSRGTRVRRRRGFGQEIMRISDPCSARGCQDERTASEQKQQTGQRTALPPRHRACMHACIALHPRSERWNILLQDATQTSSEKVVCPSPSWCCRAPHTSDACVCLMYHVSTQQQRQHLPVSFTCFIFSEGAITARSASKCTSCINSMAHSDGAHRGETKQERRHNA